MGGWAGRPRGRTCSVNKNLPPAPLPEEWGILASSPVLHTGAELSLPLVRPLSRDAAGSRGGWVWRAAHRESVTCGRVVSRACKSRDPLATNAEGAHRHISCGAAVTFELRSSYHAGPGCPGVVGETARMATSMDTPSACRLDKQIHPLPKPPAESGTIGRAIGLVV